MQSWFRTKSQHSRRHLQPRRQRYLAVSSKLERTATIIRALTSDTALSQVGLHSTARFFVRCRSTRGVAYRQFAKPFGSLPSRMMVLVWPNGIQNVHLVELGNLSAAICAFFQASWEAAILAPGLLDPQMQKLQQPSRRLWASSNGVLNSHTRDQILGPYMRGLHNFCGPRCDQYAGRRTAWEHCSGLTAVSRDSLLRPRFLRSTHNACVAVSIHHKGNQTPALVPTLLFPLLPASRLRRRYGDIVVGDWPQSWEVRRPGSLEAGLLVSRHPLGDAWRVDEDEGRVWRRRR